MANNPNSSTGKVPVTVQLDKGTYDFLKDTSALSGQTPSQFIADITRVEIKALIETLPREWFHQAAIMEKYGLEKAKHPRTSPIRG